MNDAVAGAMGTLHDLVTLRKLSPEVKNAIYLINGSGINAAIWDQDTIWSTELGGIKIHPQLAEELELDETDTLQVRPIAAGRGIEARWKNKTGQGLSGEQIAELYRDEHPLATRLIDDSVCVAAHAVIGLDRNFKLSEKGKSSLIIGHGGVFNVPGYRERLEQRLTEYFGSPTQIIIIGNHQDNPGLKGAALVVLS